MASKLITSKKQESDDWRFIDKYIDVFRIPQIYQQYYDLSEYEYIRKEVEELYREDMLFLAIDGRLRYRLSD